MTLFGSLKFLFLSVIVSLKTKKVLCDCGGAVKPKMREGLACLHQHHGVHQAWVRGGEALREQVGQF